MSPKKIKDVIGDIKTIKQMFEHDLPKGIRQSKQAYPELSNRFIGKIFDVSEQYVGQILSGKKGTKSQTAKRDQILPLKLSADGTRSITVPIDVPLELYEFHRYLVRNGYRGNLSEFIKLIWVSSLPSPSDSEVQIFLQEKE